jgi:hypothetical protein
MEAEWMESEAVVVLVLVDGGAAWGCLRRILLFDEKERTKKRKI